MKNRVQIGRLLIQITAAIVIVAGGMQSIGVTVPIIMGVTLLGGAFFCGWICPFGTIQDLISKLTWKIKKRQMPARVQTVMALMRYALLGATTWLSLDFVFTLMQFDAHENFMSLLSGRVLSGIIYGVIAFYLLLAVFFERPFCSYMCPEGAKNGLIGSLRLFRVVRDEALCVNCGKCNKVCPMHINVAGHTNVKSLQCINCFNCVATCPKKGALRYRMTRFSNKGLLGYIAAVTLAVSLMAAVWAYDYMVEKDNQTADAAVMPPVEQSQTTTQETPSVDEDATEEDQVVPSEESVQTEQPQESTQSQEPTQTRQTTQVTPSTQLTKKVKVAETTQTAPAAVTPTATPSAPATVQTTQSGYKDGVYSGQAEGFRGMMTVSVTISGGKITKVDVVDTNDDRKWLDRALNDVPDWIIQNQSSNVDSVSGATYSSLGIINATEDALKKAK